MIGRRRDVCNEIAKDFCGSNIRWRGRSYSASDPSDIPSSSRGRKKISENERKAMLESFVNSYRGMNGGKFPTISVAQSQVGGSYYTVRWFLLELKHKSESSLLHKINESISKESGSLPGSQMADQDIQDAQAVAINNVEVQDLERSESTSLDKTNEYSVEEELVEDCEPILDSQIIVDQDIQKESLAVPITNGEVQELEKPKDSPLDKTMKFSSGNELSEESETISGCQIMVDKDMPKDSQAVAMNNVEDANAEHLEGKQESQTSTWTEETLSEEVMKPPIAVKGQPDKVSIPSIEKHDHVPKKEAASKGVLDIDDPKHKHEQNHASLEVDHLAGEISGKQTHDKELPKRSTMWENLRSLANGIFDMWRRR